MGHILWIGPWAIFINIWTGPLGPIAHEYFTFPDAHRLVRGAYLIQTSSELAQKWTHYQGSTVLSLAFADCFYCYSRSSLYILLHAVCVAQVGSQIAANCQSVIMN